MRIAEKHWTDRYWAIPTADRYTGEDGAYVNHGPGVRLVPKRIATIDDISRYRIVGDGRGGVRLKVGPPQRTGDDVLTGNDPVKRVSLGRTFGPEFDRTDGAPNDNVYPLEPGKNFAVNEPVHAETVSPEDLSLIGRVFSISTVEARSMVDGMEEGFRRKWLDGLRKRGEYHRDAATTNRYARAMAAEGESRAGNYESCGATADAEKAFMRGTPRHLNAATMSRQGSTGHVNSYKQALEKYASEKDRAAGY